jgi:signal transduction histidine kinase
VKNLKNQPRTLGWLAAAGVAIGLLIIGALVFSNSRTTQATLDEAAALHAADMTLAAQDVALKSISQVVLVGRDSELGLASQETLDAAAVEAERSIAELKSRAEALSSDATETVATSIEVFATTGTEIISLATTGSAAAAADKMTVSLVPIAEAVAEDLIAERDLRAQAVDDAQRRVGTMAQIAAFLTAFLLPLGAMLVYRQSARRQLEVAEAHLDARLEAERSVGRAKDQFIANISHELRTPLTSIYGFSEVLLEEGFVDPRMAGDLVGLINTESAELARMVEDLLVAAHDEDAPLPMDGGPVEISAELDSVIAPFARRGIIIGGTHAAGTVFGDQLRIRQILRNLVANAVQHGGDTIRVYGDLAGSNYVISVEDDGPGVPDNVVPRLFTRFVHQGEAPLTSGSVGLGLAVAHLLAEAMDGSLNYERIAGRTGFVLMLPLAGTTQESVPEDDLLLTTPR